MAALREAAGADQAFATEKRTRRPPIWQKGAVGWNLIRAGTFPKVREDISRKTGMPAIAKAAVNPAYAELRNQHVWGTAWADIIRNGMTPQEAGEKAFKWVEAIFAKYPIEGA